MYPDNLKMKTLQQTNMASTRGDFDKEDDMVLGLNKEHSVSQQNKDD